MPVNILMNFELAGKEEFCGRKGIQGADVAV